MSAGKDGGDILPCCLYTLFLPRETQRMSIGHPAVTASAPSVSLSTTEKLRAAVLASEFVPGERLYEVRLSERLGVSRTPIRAALQALASDGLLDYAPHRGYSVRSFDAAEILQAYEIRAVLEGLAAKRAAQLGMGDAPRRDIEGALLEGDRLLSRGHLIPEDRIAYGAINSTIHNAILTAGQARMLGDMLRLSQQVAPSSHRNVVAFEYQDVRRRHDDHHRIFEAILCRDPGRAELLMRDHVESVKLSLSRSESWPAPPHQGR
jgi:GntR family transcriptional regulator, vanillate catabolism transcriptional regulator